MQTLIAFIIPVRNDAAGLARCLASVATCRRAFEVVVVDDHSQDLTTSVALVAGARVLPAPASATSVAALRNAGVRATTTEFIGFIDADNEIGRGWLGAALSALSDPAVAAAGALCNCPAGGTWVQQWFDGLRDHPPTVMPAEWLGSGNLVVRRASFDEVGGFDESLESCEDVDLCFRLSRAGYTLLHVPSMLSTHHGDPPTLGRLFRSELWRGRDNVRVSLRQRPMSLRNAVSVLLPVVELALAAGIAVGLVVGPGLGWRVAASGLLGMSLLLLGRAVQIYRRASATAPGGFPAALAIAATYEAARALALVVRASHHRPAPVQAVS